MRVPYRRFTDPADVSRHISALSAKTAIVDVEPLIAFWNTDQNALGDGINAILDQLAADPVHLRHVVFATNSARRLPAVPTFDGLQVSYLAYAGKPLRIAPYRGFLTPGAVIGDQIATDGVLAWRLGFAFLHYTPSTDIPVGPYIMRALGRPLRRFLFDRS